MTQEEFQRIPMEADSGGEITGCWRAWQQGGDEEWNGMAHRENAAAIRVNLKRLDWSTNPIRTRGMGSAAVDRGIRTTGS